MWEVLVAIGIVVFGATVVLAIAEGRKQARSRQRVAEIFNQLERSVDSLNSAIEELDQNEDQSGEVKPIAPLRQDTRFTENQVGILYAASRNGGHVAYSNDPTELAGQEFDGLIFSSPGELRTIRSLVRRGLLIEIAPSIYRITAEGEHTLWQTPPKAVR